MKKSESNNTGLFFLLLFVAAIYYIWTQSKKNATSNALTATPDLRSANTTPTPISPVTTTPITVPAPLPSTSCTAVIEQLTIRVDWSLSANAYSYILERSIDGGNTFSTIYTGGGTPTYYDFPFQSGITYKYRVKAVGIGGTSAPSVVASLTTPGAVTTPNTVTGCVATTIYGNSVLVTWNQSIGANTYTVERSTSPNIGFVAIKTGTTTRAHTDNTVQPGFQYYYRIIAVNQIGSSLPSNVSTAIT